jgi:predicted PurR-regulated permease PerM
VDPQRDAAKIAYRAVLLAAALVVLGLLFRELLSLLLAVLITVILAVGLAAIAGVLERRLKIPRPVGAFFGLLAGLGFIAGVLALVIPSFVEESQQLGDDAPDIVDSLRARLGDITGAGQDEIAERVQEFIARYTDDPAQLIGPITSIGLGVAGVIAALLLILITAYYIAINPEPLLGGVRRLVPPAHRDRADAVLARLRDSWIGWMQGVIVDIVVSGLLLYLGLSLIGLEFALVFAVLAALLTIIPYFGAIVGGILPTLLALTDSFTKAGLVLVVYVAVQQVQGNITIPLVMSRTVKLHPAVIAIGVLIVAQLFGAVGLIVAVPILSLIVVLVEEVWVVPMEREAERRGAAGGPPGQA